MIPIASRAACPAETMISHIFLVIQLLLSMKEKADPSSEDPAVYW
jgi:hypothetical protein